WSRAPCSATCWPITCDSRSGFPAGRAMVRLESRTYERWPMKRPNRPAGCGNYGPPPLSRRELLRRAGMGFGALALTGLLLEDGLLCAADDTPVLAGKVDGKAKSVIFLFMGGGPSQVDTWDPKPELAKLNGQDVPESIAKDVPRIARAPLRNLYASPYKFTPSGQS